MTASMRPRRFAKVGGHRRKRLLAGHVAGKAVGLAACRFDFRGRFRRAGTIDIDDTDHRAAAGKMQRSGPAESTPRAGDQHDLIGQVW